MLNCRASFPYIVQSHRIALNCTVLNHAIQYKYDIYIFNLWDHWQCIEPNIWGAQPHSTCIHQWWSIAAEILHGSLICTMKCNHSNLHFLHCLQLTSMEMKGTFQQSSMGCSQARMQQLTNSLRRSSRCNKVDLKRLVKQNNYFWISMMKWLLWAKLNGY